MNITLYIVIENGKPCLGSVFGIPISKGWNKCVFCSEKEAREYLVSWLNRWMTIEECSKVIQLNIPYNYSGFGDMIEIRSISITLGGF
jgi:hypothetical protein